MRGLVLSGLLLIVHGLCLAQEAPRETRVTGQPWTFTPLGGPTGLSALCVACPREGVVIAAAGSSIYRSIDGGVTWASVDDDANVRNLYVTPTGDVLGVPVFAEWERRWRLRISTDGGATWGELPDSTDRHFGLSVVRMSDQAIYSEGQGNLQRSTDGGRTWELLHTGPPGSDFECDYDLEILSDSVLFARGNTHVYRSGDGGRTWSPVLLEMGVPISRGAPVALLRDPAGGVLVTVVDTTATPDRAELFRLRPDGSVAETLDPGVLTFLPVSLVLRSGTMLAGSRTHTGGIMRSTDSARTWACTFVNACVSDFSQAADGTVFAAVHGALLSSTDDGRTWQECVTGLPRRHIHTFFSDGRGGWFVGTDRGLHRSTDQGLTWSASLTDITQVWRGSAAPDGPIVLGTSPMIPYEAHTTCGTSINDWYPSLPNVLVSYDRGATWHGPFGDNRGTGRLAQFGNIILLNNPDLNVSMDGGATWQSDARLSRADALAIDAHGWYAAVHDSLFRRTSSDPNWRLLHTGLGLRGIALAGADICAFEDAGFIRSSDDGWSWDPVRSPHVCCTLSALDPSVLTVLGCYRNGWMSIDGGRTWSGVDFPFDACSSLLDASHHLVVASDDCVYRSDEPLTTLPRYDFTFDPPYPNPAGNGRVSISFTVNSYSRVRLSLFDLSGKELLVLSDRMYLPGTYNERWQIARTDTPAGCFWIGEPPNWNIMPSKALYFLALTVDGRTRAHAVACP